MLTVTFTPTMLTAPVSDNRPSKQRVAMKLFHLEMCLKQTSVSTTALQSMTYMRLPITQQRLNEAKFRVFFQLSLMCSLRLK